MDAIVLRLPYIWYEDVATEIKDHLLGATWLGFPIEKLKIGKLKELLYELCSVNFLVPFAFSHCGRMLDRIQLLPAAETVGPISLVPPLVPL